MKQVYYSHNKKPDPNGSYLERLAFSVLDNVNPEATPEQVEARRSQLELNYGNEHTDVLIGEADDIYQKYVDQFRTPLEQIDRERWEEMLNVLPPLKWRHKGTGQSFMLSEFTSGNITLICIKHKGLDGIWEYWQMHDYASLTHEQIMARLSEVTPVDMMNL